MARKTNRYGMKKGKKKDNPELNYKGFTFDSKLEVEYFQYLERMVLLGEIEGFEYPPPTFVLLPAFTFDGKKYQSMKYTPDFIVIHLDGSKEVVDVKTIVTITTAVEMRVKLLKYKMSIGEIEQMKVTYQLKYGGKWCTKEEYAKMKKSKKGG